MYFNGRCEEAIEFYRRRLDAEVTALVRFRDMPDSGMSPPGAGDEIMHASLRIGEAKVWASDGTSQDEQIFKDFSLCLTAGSEADADRFFVALAEGGRVQVPLGKTPFSPRFGMVTDRLGVSWIINLVPEKQAA